MTLSVIQGTFTKSTSTSVPVTQNITGLSFTPKCIWMWTEGGTTAGVFEDHSLISYGFSDGSANGSITYAAKRGTAGTNSSTGGTIRDDSCICILDVAGTPTNVLAQGKVTGFSSGQVSFQWDANTAVASIIHYMIIGGTDITNVKVLSTTTASTATGNVGYTGVGFLPDFAQVINGNSSQTTINATSTNWVWSVGAAQSTTARWQCGGHSEHAVSGSTDTYTFKEGAKFFCSWTAATAAREGIADFASFDSDGLTLNYSTANINTTQRIIFLCIKGGLWDVGNFVKRTSAGTQDVTITTGRVPEAVQFISHNNFTNSSGTAGEAGFEISVCGTDGTNEGSVWCGQADAANGNNCRGTKTDKAVLLCTERTTSSTTNINAEADISDMSTAGKYQLNWTTSDSGASYVEYWVLSPSAAAPTNYDRPLTTETISISESLARLKAANRPPATETIAISESQARAFIGVRAMSAETITVTGGTLARLYTANRVPTAETITIGESLVRLLGANRALSDTTVISESLAKVQVLVRSLTDTTAISESLTKVLTLVRNLSAETTAISESITRIFVGIRAISETTVIGESIARLKAATRSLSDTTAISESLARTFGVVRSLSDTVSIGESLSRVLSAIRTLSDTNAISESLAKVQVLVRSLSDTGAISESLARILGINRSLLDTTAIGESLTRVLGAIRALATQTTTIGESLSRVFGAVRTLSDTTIISESLARLIAVIRSLSDTTVITGIVDSLYTPVGGGAVNYIRSLSDTVNISENLVRSISNARSLIETSIIGESLNRILGIVRALSDTTTISESLVRILSLTRSLSDTTIISESLVKVYGVIRNISDTIVISESLSKILSLTRSLSDTTIVSESLSRIVGLTRVLLDTTIINELLTRVYGIVKSLSDTTIISDSVARLANMVRSLTQSVIILESLVRTIIGIIVDYVPSLETDFTNYIDEMILPYIFAKWNATGQLLKGNDMIDVNSPVEFKIGIHSSRPYQVLVLEHQTEINKLSINKFGGGISQFYTTIEVTVMVQRLQRDIPIELSQMEKEIQRIVCHYRRNEIMGIDDLILVGMRREFTGRKKDWSKSIWSTKIYFKAEYLKVNTEIMI